MKLRASIVIGALFLGGLFACAEPFSNDDLAFLKALPSRQQVEIAVPGTATTTSGLRPSEVPAVPARPTRFYVDAAKTSHDLNQIAYFVLGIVDLVQSFPPTAREGDTRGWGPFPGDPGDPGEYQMIIARTSTQAVVRTTSTSTATMISEYYDYVLQGRRRGTSTWLNVFYGRYAPSAVLAEGMGAIMVSFEAVREIKGSNDRGLAYITYDNRFGQQTIEMAFDLVIDPAHPFQDAEAGYRFHAEPDGDKRFAFGFKQNIPELQPDTGPELFITTARWLPDQRGRANVVVEGGDLGTREFYGVECWDGTFSQTFLGGTIPDLVPYGALTDCAPELQNWLSD